MVEALDIFRTISSFKVPVEDMPVSVQPTLKRTERGFRLVFDEHASIEIYGENGTLFFHTRSVRPRTVTPGLTSYGSTGGGSIPSVHQANAVKLYDDVMRHLTSQPATRS